MKLVIDDFEEEAPSVFSLFSEKVSSKAIRSCIINELIPQVSMLQQQPSNKPI